MTFEEWAADWNNSLLLEKDDAAKVAYLAAKAAYEAGKRAALPAKPTEALATLKEFNAWRRGAEIPQPCPKKIGQAIDEAISFIEGFKK